MKELDPHLKAKVYSKTWRLVRQGVAAARCFLLKQGHTRSRPARSDFQSVEGVYSTALKVESQQSCGDHYYFVTVSTVRRQASTTWLATIHPLLTSSGPQSKLFHHAATLPRNGGMPGRWAECSNNSCRKSRYSAKITNGDAAAAPAAPQISTGVECRWLADLKRCGAVAAIRGCSARSLPVQEPSSAET